MYCRKIVIISGEDKMYGDAKGILTLSTEREGVTAKLSVYRLSPQATDYLCLIRCGTKTYRRHTSAAGGIDDAFVTDLQLLPTDKICVIVGIRDSGKPVAYGSNCGVPMWESGLVRELQPAPAPETPPKAQAQPRIVVADEEPHPEVEETPPAPAEKVDWESAQARARSAYDDEQIAEYNFYPKNLEPRIDRGKYVARAEAAASSLDAWGGYNTVYRPRLKPRPEASEPCRKDEPRVPSYYYRVKETLDSIFRTSSPERTLDEALQGTHWVRVPYRDRAHYCVGLVGTAPDYIGYAVPGKYSLNPPRQLAGLSKWLPASAAEPQGEGYWLMFQDASTGAAVRLD